MKIFLAIDNNWNTSTNVKKISFLDVWDHISATVDICWRAKRLCILVYSCMFCSDLLLFYIIAVFLRYWHCAGRLIRQFVVGREFLPPPPYHPPLSVFFLNTPFYILFYVLFNIEYPFLIPFLLFKFYPSCPLFYIYFPCLSMINS